MTARNQYMPGLQERTAGGDAGAGASAAGRGFQSRQNGNGFVAGGQDSSSPAEYLASTMQPLPLASRYGGTAKHDLSRSSASALDSTWIRRLLPSSADVGCGELVPEPAFVWRNPLPSILGGGQGSSSSPLLLAASTRDKDDIEQDRGIGDRPLEDDEDTDAKGSGNAHFLHKGNAVQDSSHGHDATTSHVHDALKNEGSSSFPSNPRIAVADGSCRQQIHQDGTQKAVLSVRGDSHVNGVSGGKMTGFGPLRVVLKPPSNDSKKVIGSSPNSKALIIEGGFRIETTAVPAGQCEFRRPTAAPTSDRRPSDVPMMTSNPGSRFAVQPDSASLSKIASSRPSRHVEFASRFGSFIPQQKESRSESRRPCTDATARETTLPTGVPKDSSRFRSLGEDPPSRTVFRDDVMLHNALGEDRPSHGHFGEDNASRRSFGEDPVTHRLFGEDHQSRGPFGEHQHSHRSPGEDYPSHRHFGEDPVLQTRFGEDSPSRRPFGEDHRQSPVHFGADHQPIRPFGEDYSSYRHNSRFEGFPGNQGGAERNKSNTSTMGDERFVPTYTGSKFGRNEDRGRINGGQEIKSWQCNRVSADANAQTSSGGGFSKGFENRKMKEVVGGGYESRRHPDVGPSHQHQLPSQVTPHLAPHQFRVDASIGKVGHRLPFAPHTSFLDEETPAQLGEDDADGGNFRVRAEPATSLLTPLFTALKPQGELGGGSRQADQQGPWKSIYTPYSLTHPETPNSVSTPTLPPDEHSRLRDGSSHLNGLPDLPETSGSNEELNGGSGRNLGKEPLPSGRPPQFDNQSSHFSSSPWPDNESHNPNDDAGSGAYNSKATGSTYHSQGSHPQYFHVPAASGFKGKQVNADKYEAANGRGFLDVPPRMRDLSVSGNLQDRQNLQTVQGMARWSGRHLRPLAMPMMPGSHKEDTSNSSPPSCPLGFYFSPDLCSPVIPRTIVDEQLVSRAVESRVVEDDSEGEGTQYARRQQGYPNSSMGFSLKKRKGLQAHDDGVHREHRDSVATRDRDQDMINMANDAHRDVSSKSGRHNGGAESVLEHGKLSTSGEAMGDASIAGPSKRSRQYANLDSHEVALQTETSGLPPREQANVDSAVITSSWLQRWMPSSNAKGTQLQAPYARPKDKHLQGLIPSSPGYGGSNNFADFSRHRSAQVKTAEAWRARRIEVENGFKARKGLKQLSQEDECSLSPYPVPSAAAIALVSTAANKRGPVLQHRKGSLSMWQSDDHKPVRGSELPVTT